jgi:hypothetical protein
MTLENAMPLLVHNVYFTLHDGSAVNRDKLLAACRKHLTGHPGTVLRGRHCCAELNRPVNDLDYDIGLHIAFKSKADHDAYQIAPRHEEFVAENKALWKKVRVFDSVAESV